MKRAKVAVISSKSRRPQKLATLRTKGEATYKKACEVSGLEMVKNGNFDYKGRSGIDFYLFIINNESRCRRELTPSKYRKSAEVIVVPIESG